MMRQHRTLKDALRDAHERDRIEDESLDDLICEMRRNMLQHGKHSGKAKAVETRDKRATKTGSTASKSSGESVRTRPKKAAETVPNRLSNGDKERAEKGARRAAKTRTAHKARKSPRGRNLQEL